MGSDCTPSLAERLDDGRWEPYLGLVPILLLDGKNVLKAFEDTDEAWTFMVRLAAKLNAAVAAETERDALRAAIRRHRTEAKQTASGTASIAANTVTVTNNTADERLWAALEDVPVPEPLPADTPFVRQEHEGNWTPPERPERCPRCLGTGWVANVPVAIRCNCTPPSTPEEPNDD